MRRRSKMPQHLTKTIRFQETQRVRQWWIWFMVLAAVAFAWWTFLSTLVGGVSQGTESVSDKSAWVIVILVGMLLPVFLLAARMTTTVTPEGVTIIYFPLYRRHIKSHEIKTCSACVYRPIRDFGGWGIRWGFRRGMVYSVSGNQGVQLELAGGKKLLIGSQEPEALARAIAGCVADRPA